MSHTYSIVQIRPKAVAYECDIYIKRQEKKVQQIISKLKINKLFLGGFYITIQNLFDHKDLEEQFLLFKQISKYLENAEWYVYNDEEGKIYHLQIKKGVFSYKEIVHKSKNFLNYFQVTFPKNTKGIFTLLNDRIYHDGEIAELMEKSAFKGYERDVKVAMTIDRKAWYIMQSYGVALSRRGNFKKAIVADRQALKIKHSLDAHEDYDSLLLYSNLANDLVADKQYEAGLKCALKAEHITPNRGDYRILEKKAYAYLGLKNFEMVIKTSDEIIQKSLRRADITYAFFNKACALAMLERCAESAAALATAYTMDPNLSGVAEKDPENIMIFKMLVKDGWAKDIMGETYKYIEKFS